VRDDAALHVEISLSLCRNSPEIKILSVKEAELVKLAINTFVTMKISFANFIGEISRNTEGIDASKVCEAIGQDSRIGTKYLSPGLGFGGPCFPRDNRAFAEFSSRLSLHADLALATESINKRLPVNISEWIKNKYPDKKKIAILGITYKENSEVTEESQSIFIAKELYHLGYRVLVHDPLLNQRPTTLEQGVEFTNNLGDIFECDLALKTINWEPYSEIDKQLIDVINMR
jgi:UDPglucose 6-dehydrogenase